jgi:sulfatase maturation enzyme AslB (radical SAM superfamily)
MDLPVTAPTSTLRDIKVLHLESTDVCQAACPLCARETDTMFRKDQQHHLSMDHILQVFDETKIAGLDKVFMCGNYGDPAAGKHTAVIYQEFRRINPDIVLGMNTNGAIGTTFWWHGLGQLFDQSQDYVVFSIDGLEDTNATYRRNVNWNKLMSNAKAFIAAGGSAHWDMLVYRHNQHQVDECEQLARDMGFKWFRAKVSKRPFVNGLEFPLGWHRPDSTVGAVNCHVLKEQSLYIDAQGRVSPCCWLGSTQRDFVTDFDAVQATWLTESPHAVCQQTCGTQHGQTVFNNQWQRETQF